MCIRDRYRSVTYVHIDPKEIAKDIMISKEAVEEEYDARRDELTTPGSRDLKQLIFSEEELAQKFISSITSALSLAFFIAAALPLLQLKPASPPQAAHATLPFDG